MTETYNNGKDLMLEDITITKVNNKIYYAFLAFKKYDPAHKEQPKEQKQYTGTGETARESVECLALIINDHLLRIAKIL